MHKIDRLALLLFSALVCSASLATVNASMLTPVWSLSPGDPPIAEGHTERSVAYNPVTGNVLVPSRDGGTKIYVLDGDTGAEILQLDTWNVFGGTLDLNHVGVAEDGVIYAANVTGNPSNSPFKIYRWDREGESWEVPSTVAYEGTMDGSTTRWGDTFAVRGSGIGTQILVGSLSTTAVAVFTTTDGATFTPVVMDVDGVPSGSFAHGIAFGAGNTFWAKSGGGSGGTTGKSLKHVSFDLDAASAALIRDYEGALPLADSGPIGVDTTNELLAAVGRNNARVDLYDLADLEAGPVLLDTVSFSTDNNNSLMMGAAVFGGGRLSALGVFNGVMVLDVGEKPTFDAPQFVSQPEDQTVWPGSNISFHVNVLGASPISYQWFFNDQAIAEATGSVYSIESVEASDAGRYHVVATNDFGSATSDSATLTVESVVGESGMLSLSWALPPGSRSYVTTGHTERALAVSPVTGNIYVPSRAEGADIYVVDGNTGEELLQLDTSIVSGGNLSLNHIGIADDGVIYAANVTSNPTSSPFKIYRWASESGAVAATVAYEGELDGLSRRWGDTFAVRGSGTDTQILISSLNSDKIAVLTTADGSTFNPLIMAVEGLPSGALAHGLAFGEGNTLWGKTGSGGGGTTGKSLKHVAFDLSAPSASLIQEYPNAPSIDDTGAIGVDIAHNLMAVISRNQSRVELYDIADLEAGPRLLDSVLFLNNVTSGVSLFGAAVFHEGQLAVLGTFNGVMLFGIGDEPVGPVISASGTTVTLEWKAIDGASYQVRYKDDLTSPEWLDAGPPVVASGATASYSEDVTGITRRFYRVLRSR